MRCAVQILMLKLRGISVEFRFLQHFKFLPTCPGQITGETEEKNCFVSFTEIKRLISVFDLFFPEILFFVSSVRAALSNSFSHKSHSWGCALFKHLFLLLVPLNSRFLLRFNSGLPSRMVHEYSPGRLTQILCFHSLCTQTLSNYLFSPVLENTLMHVHCKSSFYIKDALHHDGYKLSSFLYCSCCIETASLRKTTQVHKRLQVNYKVCVVK